ncbi:BatD family protein [Sulfurimonas sp. HSL3-7]|uniref:BatD family protein n=1 Tax=Sulfonitrofixus jiaomeiensis TaxID=3131938 RepID=UPI0031F7B7BF
MKLPIGKIAALLLLPLLLFAEVKVSVDNNVLYAGDNVTYTITATGSDIEFPVITSIDGNPILATNSSQNISITNGNYTKTHSKSYTFTPKASLQIPSYKVLVDGGVERTKPVDVKIVKPSQDKRAPIVLDMHLSKEQAYVGEAVRFDLVLKKKPDTRVDKLEIEEPKFEDFWVKKIDGVRQGVEGEYSTEAYSYLLFPQKSGTLKIPAVVAKVGKYVQSRRGLDPFFDNAFGRNLRVSSVISNEESLTVEPLPDGLELYGDFNINVSVDKTAVVANKPLNLTVSIDGVGNIDDIKKYSLDIDGAVIYANAPEIKARVVGEDYLGSFEQKIVIIADGNYTIPPLMLRYFDRESQKEVVKKSDPIAVEVTGGTVRAASPQSTLESKIEVADAIKEKSTTLKTSVQESSRIELLYAASTGFVVGGLFAWLLMRSRSEALPKKRRESTMAESVKKAKNDKALFELLLPYKKESAVIESALAELEKNLYYGGTNTVDKKALIDFFNGLPNEPELL